MAADSYVSATPADRQASEDPVRRGVTGWGTRTYWCWPTLVMVGLGFYQITRPVLWRDELSGWAISSRSISELLATAHKINGAQLPYYLILHYWMAVLGTSVLSMRALSVLAMAGAAVFVTLAARELAGIRAAISSGLIFAVVPSVSRFAQEVRFYAPMLFFAALATWLLVRALDRRSRALWVGYIAAMAAMGCMEIVAMSLLTGHAAWVILRWWRDRDRHPVVWFALAAVVSVGLCVPVIILGSRQAGDQVAWVAKPSFWPQALGNFGSNLFYSGPVAVAVILLALLAWKFQPRLAGYLTAATLLPLAAVCVLSEGKFSYYFPRYELFTLITLVICAGVAVAALGRIIPIVVAIVGVFVLGLHDQAVIRHPSAHNWAGYPRGVIWNTLNYELAAQVIARHNQPGDAIAFPEGDLKDRNRQVNLGVSYYLARHLRPGARMPGLALVSRNAVQANALFPVPCAVPARCVGSQPRIWLVASNGAYTRDALNQFTPAEKAALRRDYVTSYRWHVGDLAVSVLTRR